MRIGLLPTYSTDDLALAVGTQISELARPADLALLANQLVGQHDGQRHQLGRFVA